MAFTWKEVGEAVAKAAPVLGGVLGGPVGSAVGAAGSVLGSLFGVEGTPDAVMQALRKDPDALVKIKELEVQERASLLKWRTAQLEAGVDLERIAMSDRVSARKMAVDGGQADKLFWLSAFLFVASLAMDLVIIKTGFAAGVSGELVGRVMGFTEGIATTLCAFWFGSNHLNGNLANRLYYSTPADVDEKKKG